MPETAATRARTVFTVTLTGAAVNLVLALGKLVAGWLGNSAAMVADAAHSVSDFATDLAVLFFVRIAAKPSDECHAFGHGKFETLATVLIGLALFGVGLGLFSSASSTIAHIWGGGTRERPGRIALVAAVCSIVAKELTYRHARRAGERCGSPAVIANAWHHRSDAFSSIGAAMGIGGARLLGERGALLDPLAALGVSVLILHVGWRLVKPGLEELLEKALPSAIEDEILSLVTADAAVSDPHNLRTRRVGSDMVVQVHVRLDGTMSVAESHAHTRQIEARIRKRFGEQAHIIVHVEPSK